MTQFKLKIGHKQWDGGYTAVKVDEGVSVMLASIILALGRTKN